MHRERFALRRLVFVLMGLACSVRPVPLRAQFGSTTAAPRPSGQVSVYTNIAKTEFDDGVSRDFQEVSTSATYSLPERETDGLVYGIDFRHAHDAARTRADRLSVYEGYVGARMMEGRLLGRAGHLWLNDLGALGSIAGGVAEYRSRPDILTNTSAVRIGAFGGIEPNVYEQGYVDGVRKYGGYVSFDGERSRRQSVGLVTIRHGAMAERTVMTALNFLPVGRKFFMYQAAEVDLTAPAGRSRKGLNYFVTNVRVAPTLRVDVQGNFSRGRSIDSRGIADDTLNGREVSPAAIEGFFYESMGGRVSVEVAPRVRLNAGYARDRNNRDDEPTSRFTFGGYASNVAKSGLDISGSDSYIDRASGPYHSRYLSVGRQVGRAVYLSGDVSRSLAVLRFSRSDGAVVEMRPETTRFTGSAVVTVSRTVSLLLTVDRTVDDTSRDIRVLSGLTYRIR